MPARARARPRETFVMPTDLELLSALEATGSIVEACARIEITRDTGMYRLRRLTKMLGVPVVTSVRGGAGRGGTTLTESGRRVLLRGAGPLHPQPRSLSARPVAANVLAGEWRSSPQPRVALGSGLSLFVTFAAKEAEPVRVAIEPEAIVVARSRFRSSARNVLAGTIESVRPVDAMRERLRVLVGKGLGLDVVVTPRSEASLRLRPGAKVFLYLKATAVVRLS